MTPSPRPTRDQVNTALALTRGYDGPGWRTVGILAAEVRALRAELEPYLALAPQTCTAGLHPEWLVDSEHHHACPWCQVERLRAELAAARTAPEPSPSCAACGHAQHFPDSRYQDCKPGLCNSILSVNASRIARCECPAYVPPAAPPRPVSDLDARTVAAGAALLRLCDEAEEGVAAGTMTSPVLFTRDVRAAIAAAVPGEDDAAEPGAIERSSRLLHLRQRLHEMLGFPQRIGFIADDALLLDHVRERINSAAQPVVPAGEDVPARLDASADALERRGRGLGATLRRAADELRSMRPDDRAAVAAALAQSSTDDKDPS